jgi:hypothetical protein
MNRLRYFKNTFLLALAVYPLSASGDLTYRVWEDEQEKLWVWVENGTDKKIKLEEFLVTYFDAKGKPTERKFPCSTNCSLPKKDAKDYPLEKKPSDADTYRVRNIRFSVEQP